MEFFVKDSDFLRQQLTIYNVRNVHRLVYDIYHRYWILYSWVSLLPSAPHIKYCSGSTKYSLVQTLTQVSKACTLSHRQTKQKLTDSAVNEWRHQFRVRRPQTHLGGAPLVRLGVVSGVGAGPEGAVAGVGEAASHGAVAGRGVCRGEQASALQPCCHHTTSAPALTSSTSYHH